MLELVPIAGDKTPPGYQPGRHMSLASHSDTRGLPSSSDDLLFGLATDTYVSASIPPSFLGGMLFQYWSSLKDFHIGQLLGTEFKGQILGSKISVSIEHVVRMLARTLLLTTLVGLGLRS